MQLDPWVRKIPWRRARQPTPVSLPGESHGQRGLAGYSPQGRKELDTTDWLSTPVKTAYCDSGISSPWTHGSVPVYGIDHIIFFACKSPGLLVLIWCPFRFGCFFLSKAFGSISEGVQNMPQWHQNYSEQKVSEFLKSICQKADTPQRTQLS